MEKINPSDAIRLAILSGETMLSSGAETYRIEDTMSRILKNCGYEDAGSFVITTGLFVSVSHDNKSEASVLRVKKRTNDFSKIIAVNNLSRDFESKKITIDEALEEIETIRKSQTYPYWFVAVMSAVACLFFTMMFGGVILDGMNAFITGIVYNVLMFPFHKHKVSNVIINFVSSVIIGICSLTLVNFGIGFHLDFIIIGSIMPLVQGLAITNAIRDFLEGDYLSGATRSVDAVIVAISIAAGIGTVLSAWISIFGGIII